MEISVIIINYNSQKYLKRCLESIFKYLGKVNIIIIDNNSQNKEFGELINFDSSRITLTMFDSNVGFAKANNYGASKAKGDYLLFLNPDTVLIEDCVSPIISFLETEQMAGACSPKLLNEDLSFQCSIGEKPGLIFEILEATILIKIYRKLKYGENGSKVTRNENPLAVYWNSGAFLLMKRKIFFEAGGFDERYFLNYEDIDLCKQIMDLGYQNYYFPFLNCIHLNQKSQNQDFESLIFIRNRNKILFINKNYKGIVCILAKLINILGLLMKNIMVVFLFKGKEKVERKRGYMKSLVYAIKYR